MPHLASAKRIISFHVHDPLVSFTIDGPRYLGRACDPSLIMLSLKFRTETRARCSNDYPVNTALTLDRGSCRLIVTE